MEETEDSAILCALYDYYDLHPGSSGMTLGELYNAIGVSPSDSKKVGQVRYWLFWLGRKGWVECETLDDFSGGIIHITPEGMRVARDRCHPAFPEQQPEDSEPLQEPSDRGPVRETGSPQPCPATFDDLVRGRACECAVQRDDVLREIKEHFTGTLGRHHFIVLNGQAMVGKTKILERISETFSSEYVPLEVPGEKLITSEVGSLDEFLHDFTDQLTTKFEEWAENQGISVSLRSLDKTTFQGGHGSTIFYRYWSDLKRSAGRRMPIVIFDEVEHLLDHLSELSPQILTFLDDFVRTPRNGYFIMAGSEKIRHTSHKQFSNLIARGHSVQVHYYDDTTVASVFDIFREYFSVDDQVLQCLVGFCDGHPRILPYVYQAVKSTGKQKLGLSDVEPILTAVTDQTDHFLWDLWLRLSPDERHVVWLISQKMSDLIDRSRYSLRQLLDLAGGGIPTGPSVNYESLRKGVNRLVGRQWAKWEDRVGGLFCFRLGIVPFWVRLYDIPPDEVSP